MLQEAAPLLLPLALAPAALLLRLLDPRLQILIKLNNLKKSQILVNFTHFNKKIFFLTHLVMQSKSCHKTCPACVTST